MFERTKMFFALLFAGVSIGLSSPDPPENMKKFVDSKVKIGFDRNCYLYFEADKKYDDVGKGKFKCADDAGDSFTIVQAETGGEEVLYQIQDVRRALYAVRRGLQNKYSLRFKPGVGDLFWIREISEGLFTIGFNKGKKQCPLHLTKSNYTRKSAHFRCGKITDAQFFIKVQDCDIQVIPQGDVGTPIHSGDQIIGENNGGSCDIGKRHSLALGRTDSLTEDYSVQISNSRTTSFQKSFSVQFGISKFVTFNAQAGYTRGTSSTFNTTKTKATGETTSTITLQRTPYDTPGAALIIGYAKKYKSSQENVPATVVFRCKNGYAYNESTKITLSSKTFSRTFYRSYVVKIKQEECNEELLDCADRTENKNFMNVRDAGVAFKLCFKGKIEGEMEERELKV